MKGPQLSGLGADDYDGPIANFHHTVTPGLGQAFFPRNTQALPIPNGIQLPLIMRGVEIPLSGFFGSPQNAPGHRCPATSCLP